MRKLLLILGQTASGKNALSHYIALKAGASVISVDSMKIYRGMDIGTAKPSIQKREEVDYFMIDVIGSEQNVDVKWFTDTVDDILKNNRHKKFVLSGGSALYIKAILSGVFDGVPRNENFRTFAQKRILNEGIQSLYEELRHVDPDAALKILAHDEKRIVRALEVYHMSGKPISELQQQFQGIRDYYSFTMIGLRYEREVLYERINRRVEQMFEKGLVKEVTQLHDNDRFGRTSCMGIGYKEIIDALKRGEDPAAEQIKDEIKKNTRHFSRKQMTWFKKFEKVNWIDWEPENTVEDTYKRIVPFLEEIGYD